MKVLVCPLNWGLGHATRCVPIIRQLLADGHEPIIAAEGLPLAFLQSEFPNLPAFETPGYNIRYGRGKSQIGAMLRCMPSILKGIWNEHRWLSKFIANHRIDKVISDNRFGLWNKKIESVYITHQLMIKMPSRLQFLEPVVWLLHRCFITRYDICWIPDFASQLENLSGDLSHKYKLPKNAVFIGAQSRFDILKEIAADYTYNTVCIVSGPEPQRTLFEEVLLKKYESSNQKTLIIQGKPNVNECSVLNNITLTSHINSSELAAFLKGCSRIVARSGYTTIMDLYTLGCLYKAEFIPTPGQTEQEYLAKLHSNN